MDETPSPLVARSPAAKNQAVPSPVSEPPRVPSFEAMDRLGRAVTARLTQGISPHALYAASFDWATHLANAPGRLIELGVEAVNIGARFARFATHSLSEHAKVPFELQAGDRRFSGALWNRLPYS
jgi:polyhydroxyalkanoate synthase subunit PhaC